MAWKNGKYIDDSRERIEAQWYAMQAAKERKKKEDAQAVANFANMPDWVHVGIHCIEVMSEREFDLISIDKTKPAGLTFLATGYPQEFAQEWELEEFIDNVRRGIDIVYGYTPPELADGFKHSRHDWYNDGVTTYIAEPETELAIRLEKQYNKLKPRTLQK